MNFFPLFFIVEQSLNTRPLVPASTDAIELDALMPNHFRLRKTGSLPPSLANDDFDHREQYALAHAHSDVIWSRWLKEYVSWLNSRTKWPSDLQTGDFV